MTLRSIKKQTVLVYFLLVMGIIAIYYLNDYSINKKAERLLKNFSFTEGWITEIVIKGKTASYIKYRYRSSDQFKENEYYEFNRKNASQYRELKDSIFRVIYDSTDENNSALLLRKEDYEKWDIPLDSMGFVIDFY